MKAIDQNASAGGASVAKNEIEFIATDGNEDALALQYIGAASLLRWDALPEEVRGAIYNLATSGKLIGLDKGVQLAEQIDRLIRRNTRPR
jgi:hypothetical protein